MATSNIPEGVSSFLDNDLYKFNMQYAVLQYFPKVKVEYKFTNRTPQMRLSHAAVEWLQRQIDMLEDLRLRDEEMQYLRERCRHLDDEYLQYLSSFRLRPMEQVKLSATPVAESDYVDIDITIEGLWVETIMYEIPLLALTSEAYFRFVDTDWTHDGQEEAAYQKGVQLLQAGCEFSEFGSRRRRDLHTHDLVMKGLTRSMRDHPTAPGRLLGTSNVYLAMKHGVEPIGTVAHEWYMTIAAINNDYEHANELGLKYWLSCFGEGVMGIALTDTFGTPDFFKAFKLPIAHVEDASDSRTCVNGNINGHATHQSYAQVFTGVRQDSGDPKRYIQQAASFYDSVGINDKSVIFSDSLNVEKCIEYKALAESKGLKPSFGVGTFLTNDFKLATDESKKSKPMNIVIKVSKAAGNPCVKISDDMNKNTGDKAKVKEVKNRLGYEEKPAPHFDESKRW